MGSRMGGVVVGLLLVACDVPDGGTCSSDEECASNRCTRNVCEGSRCSSAAADCEPGWDCVVTETDWFFGIQHSYCFISCFDGICPTEYACGGELCSYVGRSLRIVWTPERPPAREPFQLTAVLSTEPSGTTFRWTYPDGSISDLSQSRTIELSLEPGSHIIGVTADVHMGIENVLSLQRRIDVCPLAGDPCEQQHNVPCCAGLTCDQTTHVCR